MTYGEYVREEFFRSGGSDESLGTLGARAAKKLERQIRERSSRVHAYISNERFWWDHDFQDKPEVKWCRSVFKGISGQDC